jgi:hypothetical protein
VAEYRMWLEEEQKELLAKFVEAHRSAPRELRGPFIAVARPASFFHSRVSRLRFGGSLGDAEVLARSGFLQRSYNSGGGPLFYVLPEGIRFYEEIKRSSSAVETAEEDIRRFLSAPEFKQNHPLAYAKWDQAATALWSADSAQQLTTVGHLCRESLWEFADSLATHCRVDVSHIDKAKTVARLKAILAQCRISLGSTETEFLEALVAYWGTVSDLVQRQEHGSQRESRPLAWEDARRAVFQTCIVMYELTRAVVGTPPSPVMETDAKEGKYIS